MLRTRPRNDAEIKRLALERITVTTLGKHAISLTMATNPLFDNPRLDPSLGVEPDAEELAYASAAMAYRVQRELGEQTRLKLRDWVNREIDRRGGRGVANKKTGKGGGVGKLAAALLGLDLEGKKFWDAPTLAAWKAEKRKMEEYTQVAGKTERTQRAGYAVRAKYTSVSPERQARIADLPGAEEGNPYVPASTLWTRNLERAVIRGGILGDWQISEREYHYTWKRTLNESAGEEPATLHEALATGEGLIQAIVDGIDQYIGSADRFMSITQLLHCYGVAVDLSR